MQCPYCNLNRTCASDSSLFECACPSGTVDDSGMIFVEFPFTARWWKRFTFMDFIVGSFGGVVGTIFWAGFLLGLHSVVHHRSCRAVLPKSSEECKEFGPSLIMFALSGGGVYFTTASGPVGFFFGMFVSLSCFSWLAVERHRISA